MPTGVVVEALINAELSAATNELLYISPLSTTDLAAGSGAAPLAQLSAIGVGASAWGYVRCLTNTSGQVRSRLLSGAAGTLYLSTTGWVDRRGRDT